MSAVATISAITEKPVLAPCHDKQAKDAQEIGGGILIPAVCIRRRDEHRHGPDKYNTLSNKQTDKNKYFRDKAGINVYLSYCQRILKKQWLGPLCESLP